MQGACLCGAVQITAEPAREKLTVCHCGMCRKWCSGPFVSMAAKPESVSISGPVALRQTSEWAERAHCGECGSALWYRQTEPQSAHNFAAGLFDTGEMALGLELWIDAKPAGYALEGDHRRMTGAEIIELVETGKW